MRFFKRFFKMDQTLTDQILWYLGIVVLVLALVFTIGPSRFYRGLEIGDRTLVFTQWWQAGMDTGALEELVREFEAENPGIRVKLDTRPYSEIRKLLGVDSDTLDPGSGTTVVDKGFAPDIIGVDPRWLRELVQNDQLEPFPAYREPAVRGSSDPQTEDLRSDDQNDGETGTPQIEVPGTAVQQTDTLRAASPQTLTSGAGEEAVTGDWARPLVSFMTPLFYNSDILQAAGYDRPPKTQAEFAEIAKAITDPGAGRYGFALGLGEQDPQGVYRDIFSWIWAAGQPMTGGGSLKFDTPQTVAALRFLQGLNTEGVIAPGSFTKTGQDRLEEFKAGKIGMMIASIQDTRALNAVSGRTFGITTIPVPGYYSGKPVFGLTTWCAGISRTSKYKTEARAFVAFLVEHAPIIAVRSGAIHDNSNAVGAGQNDDLLPVKAYDIYEAGGGLEEFAGFPKEVFLERVVREEVRRMLEEDQTPEYTAAVIEKQSPRETHR